MIYILIGFENVLLIAFLTIMWMDLKAEFRATRNHIDCMDSLNIKNTRNEKSDK